MRTHGSSQQRIFATVTAVVAVLLALAGSGRAQEVGTIAGLAGTVEIGRGGAWAAAVVGAAVRVGDSLRTGRPGRVGVVFRDDSVLTLADESELVVNEQVFEPDRGILRSLIYVVRGKVKALVSEYYSRPKARYEIETMTAVAGVRGTEFVIVFDPVAEVTSVAGVTGTAEVHSVLDRVRHGVFVGSHDLTTVARGRFPTPPTRIEETLFRQYLDGLEFITAKADSLTVAQKLLSGGGVAASEGAAAFEAPPAAIGAAPVIGGPQFESRQAGAFDQPPSVLQQIHDNRGEIGVQF